MTQTKKKIAIREPRELHGSTQLGKEMELLVRYCANGFSDEPGPTKVRAAQTLSSLFIQGSTGEESFNQKSQNIIRNFRALGATTLAGSAVVGVAFSMAAPLIAVGVVAAAASEGVRHRLKKIVQIADSRLPEAQKTIDAMIDVLDRATQLQKDNPSIANLEQLDDTLDNLGGLFSEEIGYNPIAFNGRKFSYAGTDFEGSPYIKKINDSLLSALETFDKGETRRDTDPKGPLGIQHDLGRSPSVEINQPATDVKTPGHTPRSLGGR